MSTFNSVEEAREYFRHDRFALVNGVHLDELGEDWSRASLDLTADHKNANNGVMGGAIFTLADLAFAAAANNVHRPTVAQQVSVNFLAGSKGTKLIAAAVCKKNGRSSAIYNVDVVDDLGRDIAQIVFTGFKL